MRSYWETLSQFLRQALQPKKFVRQSARQKIGQAAEDKALTYLINHGLKFVTRNFRCKVGEIDLIMRDKDTLVFVEVRSRLDYRQGSAASSITPQKQARLRRAAQYYLLRHPNIVCRFDVVTFDHHELTWLINAFSA